MRFGIGWQLAISFVLTTLLAVGVSGYLLFDNSRQRLLHEREITLLVDANMIAGALAPVAALAPEQLPAAVREHSRRLGARLLVINRDRTLIADALWQPAPLDTSGFPPGTVFSSALVEAALQGQQRARPHRLASGERVMYAAVPIVFRGDIVGVLYVSASLADIHQALSAMTRQLGWYLGLSALVTAAVSTIIGLRLTDPIRRLDRAAQAIAAGRFDQRVDIRARHELGTLGRSFNRMAAQLEQLEESRRRFIADASHEMRTPLSAINVLADSLRHEPDTTPEQAETLAAIDRQIDRLAALIDSLLTLTRLEQLAALQQDNKLEAFDLKQLLTTLRNDLTPLAAAKAIALNLDDRTSDTPIQLAGDSAALAAAFRNLLTNALQHTPQGGRVDVRMERARRHVVITVADTGRGIPADALPHVFERFYRVDPARSRGQGGFGLGLAIAHQAVMLHRGEIAIDSAPGRGTTVTVRLPLDDGLHEPDPHAADPA